MCELFAMSARYPATVNLSLEAFARHGCESLHYADGWGVAYALERSALVFKEPAAACDSDLVRYVETHHLQSRCVISHIRRSTTGRRSFENTQPFSRELTGRSHVFAHNGDLPGVFADPSLRPGRYSPLGETDSEHAFCALLERIRGLWTSPSEPPKLEERLAVVGDFAKALRAHGPANFVYCDGDALFVHGHRRRPPGEAEPVPPGLHVLLRSCPAPASTFDAPGLSVVSQQGERKGEQKGEEQNEQQVFLAASVPLTDESWEPLAEGELIAVSEGAVRARLPM
jgi:glutamine amidotransferase